MTALARRKTRLRFETSDLVRGRAVMVDVTPYTATLRLKGQRKGLEISWAGIYWQAAKLEADRRRAERQARRQPPAPST
jgi:hypothetical protein